MSRPPGRPPITKEQREERRKQAEERNARWAALGFEAQLAVLDDRGLVAAKQRKKIAKAIRKAQLEAKDAVIHGKARGKKQ